MITALQDDHGIFPGCVDDVKDAEARRAFVRSGKTKADIAVVGLGGSAEC